MSSRLAILLVALGSLSYLAACAWMAEARTSDAPRRAAALIACKCEVAPRWIAGSPESDSHASDAMGHLHEDDSEILDAEAATDVDLSAAWQEEKEGYHADLAAGIEASIARGFEALGRDPLRADAIERTLRPGLGRAADLLERAYFPAGVPRADVERIRLELAACRESLLFSLETFATTYEANAWMSYLDDSGWFQLDEPLLAAAGRQCP